MPDIIDFPLCTLTPSIIGINFAWNSRSGGSGFNGVTQVVSPLSGLWELAYIFEMAKEKHGRTYRALKMEMKGRFGWVRLPIFDPWRVRFVDAGWPTVEVPWSDEAPWSDETPWAFPDITTTVGADGLLGDEEITLEVASINDALETGHFFSINDYLYLIVRPVNDMTGGKRRFKIGPPLRQDVTVGDEVKVGRPTILCRLADDRSGSTTWRLGKFGEPSMEFIEVLER